LPSGDNDAVEPSAAMRAGAHSIREIFIALTMEGFSEKQALVIVGQMMSAAFNSGDDKE
jgi:hypothetical protein